MDNPLVWTFWFPNGSCASHAPLKSIMIKINCFPLRTVALTNREHQKHKKSNLLFRTEHNSSQSRKDWRLTCFANRFKMMAPVILNMLSIIYGWNTLTCQQMNVLLEAVIITSVLLSSTKMTTLSDMWWQQAIYFTARVIFTLDNLLRPKTTELRLWNAQKYLPYA